MTTSLLTDLYELTMLRAAREAGVDFVDHADIYGRTLHECERRFAEAMRLTPAERDGITIQTKAGIVREGPYFDHSCLEYMAQHNYSLIYFYSYAYTPSSARMPLG